VLAATASFIGEQIDVLELQPSPDEKRPWSLVVRIPGHELPVVVAVLVPIAVCWIAGWTALRRVA